MEVSLEPVETADGSLLRKTGRGYGFTKSKPEYDSLAAAAEARGITLEEVKRGLELKKKSI